MYSSFAIAAVMLIAADDPNAVRTNQMHFVGSQPTQNSNTATQDLNAANPARRTKPVAFRGEAPRSQPVLQFVPPPGANDPPSSAKARPDVTKPTVVFPISRNRMRLQPSAPHVVSQDETTVEPPMPADPSDPEATIPAEAVPAGNVRPDGMFGVGPTYADETEFYEEGIYDAGPIADSTYGPIMPVHSPGNMPMHIPYVHKYSEYYYFRPYNWFHIREHQEEVLNYGGDARHPYTNRVFADVYKEFGLGSHPAALPIVPLPRSTDAEAEPADLPESSANTLPGNPAANDASTAALGQ